MIISVFDVWNKTVGAVLYSVLGISKIPAAVFAESIKRAIAKQAVEAACIGNLVTGEIFTVGILKKAVVIFHRFAP